MLSVSTVKWLHQQYYTKDSITKNSRPQIKGAFIDEDWK
jgi:hypothetical protein